MEDFQTTELHRQSDKDIYDKFDNATSRAEQVVP
jgi:hypothetical protein